MIKELLDFLLKSKEFKDTMTSDAKVKMLRRQAEDWVKAETQWAKDFREEKCERD